MANRISLLTITVFFAAIFVVSAVQIQQTQAQQTQPRQARPLSQPRTPAAQQPAQQPAQPQPVAGRPRPIQPPFVLSAEQKKYIDELLAAWEATNKTIKTFSSSVRRFRYDTVFGPKDGSAMYEDEGVIKYARPDKGLFEVKGDRPEQWVCDGKSG